MPEKAEKRKWDILKTQLAERIVSGNFEFNQRFPGIQQIAEEYHISYLTADKAMKSLAAEGYLRCRNGVGHFVSYVPEETVLPQKIVQFIISVKEYRERKNLFQEAEKLFHTHGWRVRLMPCSSSNISSLLEEINSPDTFSIVCGLSVPWQHFQASFGHVAKRVLILGSLAGNTEITSIISDEYETICQAMAYLGKQNRRHVAIIAAQPKQELEALRLGAWHCAVRKSGHTPEWIARHCFSFSENKQKYSPEEEYPRLLEWLKSIRNDCDGLIVPTAHKEVIKGCLQCGIRIPQEFSLLLIARTTPEIPWEHAETLPEIDVLDHNYAGHFQCALEILEERFRSGKNSAGNWYFCPPGSIRKCRKKSE